jgi:hypothetical protein
MAKVFIGCPSHDGRLYDGCAKGLYAYASRDHDVECRVVSFSLLTLNCNALWAFALNRHQSQQTAWFAMLHSDVAPEAFWLDKLIAEAERHQADIVSVVIPIKDDKGLTSTAISLPRDERRAFFRLTMSQVLHPNFPVTFDCESARQALGALPEELRFQVPAGVKLLCNTGCVVCRLGRPWCDPDKVHFDEVATFERMNDKWNAIALSEDWFFTARAADNGAKVMATKAIKVLHHGGSAFANDQVWGDDRDEHGLAQ